MNYTKIRQELYRNRGVFEGFLKNVSKEEYLWKPAPEKWCLLEITCHLFDEEREDFRARVSHVLLTPELPMPPIDPVGWVAERKYLEQDYSATLDKFLHERENSIAWLRSLKKPIWDNAHTHPNLGRVTAGMFLVNWAAHDLFHIRQITRLKYDYLKTTSGESLSYAGVW